MPAPAVLLLALACATAPAPPSDCAAGLCIDQPFDLAAAGEGRQVGDWPDPATCTRVSGGRLPAGVGMMLLDGRIARFEIGLSGGADAVPEAPSGLRPGMTLAEAGVLLPDGGVEPGLHKYAWPPGPYPSWRDAARDRAVRIELPDGVAETILRGRTRAVEPSEGRV